MRRVGSVDDYDEEQLSEIVRAARMRDHLLTGGALQPLDTRLRLPAGESAYLDDMLICSRFYRTDSIDGPIRTWLTRHEHQAQWRDHDHARTVLTDVRMMISHDGEWLSFPHQSVVELEPQPVDFRVNVEYHGATPVQLSGGSTPCFAVVLTAVIYGVDHLAEMPEFRLLDAILDEFG